MHNFRKLDVWAKSIQLVKEIYPLISKFPTDELYGISAQIKRSAISIPSNIAEGCGRGSNNQLRYHLGVSLGSCFELETQILIAFELSFINCRDKDLCISKISEIEKMIIGLKQTILK